MSAFHSTLSRSLGPNSIGITSRGMDDLFDRLFYPADKGKRNQWVFPVSIWEEGEHFHLEIDLPGVSAENVDLTFDEGRLSVAVERTRHGEDNRKYVHDERYWGAATRTFALPDSVDPESIEATYRDGVLHVQLAKRPEVLPKKIEINAK